MEQPISVSMNQEEVMKGQLPKNIRQVGEVENRCRVYMEDYVHTFIKKAQEYAGNRFQAGILLGKTETIQSETCCFINGAIMIDELWGENGEIQFTATVWKKIYEEIRTYFPKLTMQGWFLAGKEETEFDIISLEKIHRSAFLKEEGFLCLCSGEELGLWMGQDAGLTELHGFYIYYERNEAMQEYMIGIGQSSPSERITEETAVQNFRNIMEQKKVSNNSSHRIVIGIALAAAAVVLFLAGDMWRKNISQGKMGGSQEHMVQAEVDADLTETKLGRPSTQWNSEMESLEESLEVSQLNTTEPDTPETDLEQDGTETNLSEGSSSDRENNDVVAQESESSSEDSLQAGIIANYYEVQAGDTLVEISMSFYGTLDMIDAICQANDIQNPNEIYSGQKIRLP